MSTPITPLKAPAIGDLRNALQLAAVYGDKDIADSDAKQALGRIRGLIAQALAKLGEPNAAAVNVAHVFTGYDWPTARDAAASVLYAALTGETPDTGWIDTLPCPACHGTGMFGEYPCEDCKGAGRL